MHLTDLESRLSTDLDGSTRDLLLNPLRQTHDALLASLKQPLDPKEYASVRGRIEGCEAAMTVIKTVSRRLKAVTALSSGGLR
jgi:type III secretion system YseE family protein